MRIFKGAMRGALLTLSAVVSLLVLLGVSGCDEGAQVMKPVMNDLVDDGAKPPTTVGAVKQEVPEEVAIAEDSADMPAADSADTTPPTVTAVAYYRDWRRTESLTAADIVRPGDTVYAQVVFSEAVAHVVSDDNDARPVLSFVVDAQATRLRVAAHGASGEDFLSGVCKPLHGGVDDYICKITVPAQAATLALRVEAATADVAGNPVADASVHTAPFLIMQEPVVEPLTVVSITHYRDDGDELIPEGASVDEGTTITTEIVFSVPVRANSVVLSYLTRYSVERPYQSTGVHWRGSYQVSADGTVVRSKMNASEEVFSLVVERAASLDGSVLKTSVSAPDLSVVPSVQPIPAVPQEPTPPTPQMSVVPDAVERRAMRLAEKVSAARVRVAAKGSREGNVNFSQDWRMALDAIAAEEGVAELSRDLALDLYYIYFDHSPHPMTDYVARNWRDAPSLVLGYFRLRFLHPKISKEAVLELFKADVQSGAIKVFLM